MAQLANARLILAVLKQLDMELVIADVSKAYWKGRFNRGTVYMWAAPGFFTFQGKVWEVLAPINGLGDSGHTWYQSVAEIMRLLGFKHNHSDPCFFRRLRGPDKVYQYPDFTDCEKWRRSAPNADFNPHHVETINPEITSALPYPNVLQTADPTTYEQGTEQMQHMIAEEVQMHRMEGNAVLEMVEQLKCAVPGQEKHFYYEIALWYVDDLLLGTYDKKSIIADLNRRFGKMTIHENGGMFLGHDVVVTEDAIILKLKTYMERVVENLTEKGPEHLALNSLVGILNWATSCVFGTHRKEARNLASNVNLERLEDLETVLSLIQELHSKREQGIYFRSWDDGEHIFTPRTSRVEGIADVSSPHRVRATKSGGVTVTKDDVLNCDDGYNV